MDILGKLEKMKILAFKDSAYTQPAAPPFFPVLVNPETYSLDYSIEYNTDTAQGSNSAEAAYVRHSPEQFTCDLWFDNTGILDELPRPDVYKEVEEFRKFLLDVEGSIHEPHHFMVIWGKMLFKGRVTAVQIQYKLFKPDGTPIRAMVKVTFKGSFDKLLSLAQVNLLSPDLTHVRTVKAGDTLSNLCHEIYDSPRYVNAVARVNNLANYRNLVTGQTLVFPPFDKKDKN